jgi:V/A-type H+/Na+-transporting ATPase subunit C
MSHQDPELDDFTGAARAALRSVMRDDLEFARFVAQLRVIETRLLTRAQLLRMVEAPDAETAFRQLGDTEYAPALAVAHSVADYEATLAAELSRVFELLRNNIPQPELIDVLGIVYDWQNLKTVLKAMLIGKPIDASSLVRGGNLSHDELLALGANEHAGLADLPEPYRDTAIHASQVFAATGDPQEVDLILDARRFPSIISKSRSLRYELLATVAETTADLTNLRTIMRLGLLRASRSLVERALVPGGVIPHAILLAAFEAGLDGMVEALGSVPYSDVLAAGVRGYQTAASLSALEKLMDDRLLSLVRGARFVALGPDPVIAYLLAKESEIKNLRIIFTGKINRLPENTIRERLRETYA